MIVIACCDRSGRGSSGSLTEIISPAWKREIVEGAEGDFFRVDGEQGDNSFVEEYGLFVFGGLARKGGVMQVLVADHVVHANQDVGRDISSVAEKGHMAVDGERFELDVDDVIDGFGAEGFADGRFFRRIEVGRAGSPQSGDKGCGRPDVVDAVEFLFDPVGHFFRQFGVVIRAGVVDDDDCNRGLLPRSGVQGIVGRPE